MRRPLHTPLGASLLLALLLLLASAAAAGTPACLHQLSSVSGDATSAFTRLADGPALSTDACSTQTSDRLVIVGGFGPLAADGASLASTPIQHTQKARAHTHTHTEAPL